MVTYLGNNLKVLRERRGLKQSEFAAQLTELMGRTKAYGVPAVSAWETGHKTPPMKTLEAIALFFGISVSELIGQDEIPDSSESAEHKAHLIPFSRLEEVHGEPVYLTFKDMARKPQWALLNFEKQCFILANGDTLSLQSCKKTVEVRTLLQYGTVEKERKIGQSLTVTQLKDKEKVWVQLYGFDEYLHGHYDGWYTVNLKSESLVGENGILPMNGVSNYFGVYRSPI